MHEYSIVAALVDRVAREAGPRHAHVQRLAVTIGELAGVDVPLLQTAYDTFRAGTVCADAELTIRQVAAEWRCPGCDTALARGAPLRCATCGRPARLTAGDEIILERIEMEVPDV
ncbi:MAG: hydrogenase maturation nickel metallochaperone HypA [Kofleriaceae bacterium]|nr:hydrogenase maturation nickel metallochaperone HypA [Kofleriaceae bacterium]